MSQNSLLKQSLLGAAAAVLLSALAFTVLTRAYTPSAKAAQAPVTHGDVEAILHAGFTAGQDAILVHAHQVLGAPVEEVSRAAIDFFTPGPPPHNWVART